MNNYYMPNNYNRNDVYSYAVQKFYDPNEGFIKGNMEISTYSPYKNIKPFEIMPINDQARLLTQIDSLGFAMLDLNLYLDVFPDDRNAINVYNQYRVQKEQLVKSYEGAFGPLTLSSEALNTYPWIWNERPWPWER